VKQLPDFLSRKHDERDPSPWLALFLDQSTPLSDEVKQAWLKDSSSASRQFLLPLMRPVARILIILNQLIKLFLPKKWAASKFLHYLLAEMMKNFLTPEANWLVLRHFHIGSQILAFVAANAPVSVMINPLEPRCLDDLKDELFLKHDLNLFNFVIRLNQALREAGVNLDRVGKPDFSMLKETPLRLEDMPKKWTNFIDLETAIECFTPVYQFFLTDNDFWRAANSLQLDETLAIYAATIIGKSEHLVLLNNKHPLVPLITLGAGYRLVLHGLSTEMLHALLMQMMRAYNNPTAF
jgi:hypothetical protein